jgi:hypothetical protein
MAKVQAHNSTARVTVVPHVVWLSGAAPFHFTTRPL